MQENLFVFQKRKGKAVTQHETYLISMFGVLILKDSAICLDVHKESSGTDLIVWFASK